MGRVTARLLAGRAPSVVGCDLDPEGAAETVRLAEADGGSIDSTAPVDLATAPTSSAGSRMRRDRTGASTSSTTTRACRGSLRSPSRATRTTCSRSTTSCTSSGAPARSAWPHLAEVGRRDREHRLRGWPRGCPHAAAGRPRRGQGCGPRPHPPARGRGHRRGIRVNSVSPGVMATPPILAMTSSWAPRAGRARVERTITAGRETRSRSPMPACTWRRTRRPGSRAEHRGRRRGERDHVALRPEGPRSPRRPSVQSRLGALRTRFVVCDLQQALQREAR